MNPSQSSNPQSVGHVTVSQALAALATLRIGRSTFYRHLQSGLIPTVRIGAAYRLRTDTVADIAANGIPSRSAVA